VFEHTFYTLGLVVEGAARRAAEQAIATGWWAERFAREKRLAPLSEYLGDDDGAEVNEAERLRSWAQGIDARFTRQ
jgi:hypothetical protein